MCEIARSQVALMAKFEKFRRRSRLNFANFAMRAAWLRAISHTTPARHCITKGSTSDLQKSRHLQKSRVTERHNRGTKRKLKLHPPKTKREAPSFAFGATSTFALCADCGAREAGIFSNFRWPEATENSKISGRALLVKAKTRLFCK